MRLRIEVDDKEKIEERTFILPVFRVCRLKNAWNASAWTTQMAGDRLDIADIGIDSRQRRFAWMWPQEPHTRIETRIRTGQGVYTMPAFLLLRWLVVAQRPAQGPLRFETANG